MSPKAKKVNVSSVKSMDITTNEKNNMPELKKSAPEIVKPRGMIKDVSPTQDSEDDNIINTPKIEMSDKLVANLKSPSESHVKILPSEPVEEDESDKEPAEAKSSDEEDKENPDADDLTGDDENQHDSSFIDKIGDEDNEPDKKEEESKPEEKPADPKEEDGDEESTDSQVTPKEDEKKPELEKPEQDEQKDEEPVEEKQSDEEGGIVNELAEQAADSKKQKQEEKELDVRAKHIEELIEAKTYNVPIGQLSRKRNIRLVVVLLIFMIVGGLLALNFAIDAGVVDIGVEPLTDIITN